MLTAMGIGLVMVVHLTFPVHKSPSLIVAESWLSTMVSTVTLAVSKTICFRV